MNWINFKDKMPPKKLKEVLVFEIMEHMKTHKKIPHISIDCVADIYLHDDGLIYSHSGGQNLTHWMHLPAPPKD